MSQTITALAISFLTMRVREPDEDDWWKLGHFIEYLVSTSELPLVLGAVNTGVLHWHVDAAHAMQPNMQGHTGCGLTMGYGYPVVTLTKQKCNTCSCTISELVAVDKMLAQTTRVFMKAQGIKVYDDILNWDNKSAILLEKNG